MAETGYECQHCGRPASERELQRGICPCRDRTRAPAKTNLEAYKSAIERLNKMSEEEKDSSDGETLLDDMDELWKSLTDAERAEVGKYAASLS